MKQEIKLHTPIQIDGKNIDLLTYDLEEITPQLFAEADSHKMRASGSKGGNLSGAVELDYGLHLYLGFAAIVAINPSYDVSDLERIKGRDVMEVMRIGRNFILNSVEASQTSASDAPSETTPEPTTPQSQSSKKSQ